MNRFPSTVQSIIEEVDSASEWEEEHTKEDTEDKEASEKRTYENVYEYLTKGCYSQQGLRKEYCEGGRRASELLMGSSITRERRRPEAGHAVTETCDIGIFTIAIAFHIAAGNNIEDVVFDQTKMQSHLCAVLREESALTIPKFEKAESCKKQTFKHRHPSILPLW